MILVSACLCGIDTRYNGGNNKNEKVMEFLKKDNVQLVCPEQLGGLTTPRASCEILNGTGANVLDGKAKVYNSNGEDCTHQFIKGAEEVLKIAMALKADTAILKAKSPSCGCGKIYDGSFSGCVIDGNGITSELLKRNGIRVLTEEDL